MITLSGPVVPGVGGYRVLLGWRRVERLLDALAPDRLEGSDRTTLRWVGEWGRRQGVPAVMVAHESLLGLVRLVTGGRAPVDWMVDRLNARTAAMFDRVVCTTSWASAEFRRVGATAENAASSHGYRPSAKLERRSSS